MKLTKGKLSKLFKKNKQSHKKRNNKKKHHKRNTFRNNKKINLANKTLKNLKIGGTNPDEPEVTSLSPSEEVNNVIDTNSDIPVAPLIKEDTSNQDTSNQENAGEIELTSLAAPEEINNVVDTNSDIPVAPPIEENVEENNDNVEANSLTEENASEPIQNPNEENDIKIPTTVIDESDYTEPSIPGASVEETIVTPEPNSINNNSENPELLKSFDIVLDYLAKKNY